MKQNKEWFIYIQDNDKKVYAITGSISAECIDDWIGNIADEQDSGRDITFLEVSKSQLSDVKAHAKNNGLSVTDTSNIISIPRDSKTGSG